MCGEVRLGRQRQRLARRSSDMLYMDFGVDMAGCVGLSTCISLFFLCLFDARYRTGVVDECFVFLYPVFFFFAVFVSRLYRFLFSLLHARSYFFTFALTSSRPLSLLHAELSFLFTIKHVLNGFPLFASA